MKAMILEQPGRPLKSVQLPDPEPGSDQVQVAISACGVCRTDLHVVDGDLTEPKLPIIPGHEIVGTVTALGTDVTHEGPPRSTVLLAESSTPSRST